MAGARVLAVVRHYVPAEGIGDSMAALHLFDFCVFIGEVDFDEPKDEWLVGVYDFHISHAGTYLVVGEDFGRSPVVDEVDGSGGRRCGHEECHSHGGSAYSSENNGLWKFHSCRFKVYLVQI